MLLLKIEYSILIGHLCTSTTCTFKLLISYGSSIHFSITLFDVISYAYTGFFFLVALKWGKWATFFICVSLFLRFKIFHIPSNTGYNFCALNILRYKNDSKKKVKIRSS